MAGVTYTQDMLYKMNVLNLIRVKVKLPMLLIINNNDATDMAHTYSVAVSMNHTEIRMLWLRELPEKGILEVR